MRRKIEEKLKNKVTENTKDKSMYSQRGEVLPRDGHYLLVVCKLSVVLLDVNMHKKHYTVCSKKVTPK